MNRYSRIFYHIDAKDVKEKHLENLAVQKADEEKVKQILEGIKNNNSPEYSDWRWDINEAMSTGGFQQTTYPASGETALDTITTNTTDVFGDASDLVDGGTDYAANLGTEIKDRGSGTGQSGGFDVDKHLSFDGDTDYRWAILHAVDSTTYDTMIVTAIRGNDTNGGEDPDESGAQLELWYQIVGKTTEDRFLPIDYQYDGTTQDTSVTPTIIPVGSGVGNLREWTVKLPSWVRASDTKFMLYQQTSSGTGWDNYGITKIQYRRTLPISVVVGLDSPEASVFMRVSQAPKLKQTKKKRRKELENQLRAGEQYTTKQFGDAFPGSKTTLGPDPEGSPIGSEQVKRTWETQEKQPTGLERSKALDSALKGKQPGQTKTLSTFKKDQKATQQSLAQQKQIQQLKTFETEKGKATQSLTKVAPELTKELTKSLSKYSSEQQNEIHEFRKKGDTNGELNYRTELKLNDLEKADQKGELNLQQKAGYKTLQVLHNINKFLEPVSNFAETANSILGPVAGGAKGQVATNFVKKSLQMAAGQLVGKGAEVTTGTLLPADDASGLNAQTAVKLGLSILSGKEQTIDLSEKATDQAFAEIDPNKVSEFIRVGEAEPPSAKTTITPTLKGDVFENGSGYGIVGGWEVSINPDTKMVTLKKEGTLRTTSGGESVERDSKGNITRFSDIPEVDTGEVDRIVDELFEKPALQKVIKGGAKVFDFATGQSDSKLNLYNFIKNDPTALDSLKDELVRITEKLDIAGKAKYGIQGTASNIVKIREALLRLGFPKSEIEQEGGAYGTVNTVIERPLDELSPKLQKVFNEALKKKEGEGVETRSTGTIKTDKGESSRIQSLYKDMAAQDVSKRYNELQKATQGGAPATTDSWGDMKELFFLSDVKTHGYDYAVENQQFQDHMKSFSRSEITPRAEELSALGKSIGYPKAYNSPEYKALSAELNAKIREQNKKDMAWWRKSGSEEPTLREKAPERSDFPNTRSGAQKYMDAKKAYEKETVEIEKKAGEKSISAFRSETDEPPSSESTEAMLNFYEKDPEGFAKKFRESIPSEFDPRFEYRLSTNWENINNNAKTGWPDATSIATQVARQEERGVMPTPWTNDMYGAVIKPYSYTDSRGNKVDYPEAVFVPVGKAWADYKSSMYQAAKGAEAVADENDAMNKLSGPLSKGKLDAVLDKKPQTTPEDQTAPTPKDQTAPTPAPKRSDFPNTRSGAQKYMDAKKAYETKAGEKAVDDAFNIDEPSSPESTKALLNFREKDPEGFKEQSLEKILSNNKLDPRFEYTQWSPWENANNNAKKGWPWATAVADGIAKQVERGVEYPLAWVETSMYGAKVVSHTYTDKDGETKTEDWVYTPKGQAWQDHLADTINVGLTAKGKDYRVVGKGFGFDRVPVDKYNQKYPSKASQASTSISAPQRSDFPNTRSGAKQYTDAKKTYEKIEKETVEIEKKAVESAFKIDEPISKEIRDETIKIYEKDPDLFRKMALENVPDELDDRFDYRFGGQWQDRYADAPYQEAAQREKYNAEKGIDWPYKIESSYFYGAVKKPYTYDYSQAVQDSDPWARQMHGKTIDAVYFPTGTAWKDHIAGMGEKEKIAPTTTETLSSNEIKSLKSQGITDTQIKRAMDAGGAKDLRDLAADDVYSNTADEKVNRIVSRSQGNINNITDSDLQYLMDKGYPIDDWLYGGKTGSPVGDLAMLGLSAAAVKATLPAVIKAGGSLVNLVKSEWGMRAITDSAYKTFEATGKMPPWYHWAAHKLLPQPVLNVFAKMTGTEAAKSILYTKGTAAGSALWRTLQATGAAATVQKLMFEGKTDQANDIIKNEWVKQTDEKINQMSSDKVSSELNQMFDADEAGTLQKYETVLDNDPGWKVFNNKWERLEKDIDTQIDAHNKTYESLEPLEVEEYKAYREYNSAAWGGYQDRETNTWVKTPELEWSKETEEQSFARAGVSYASYESAIKSAGTDSSGEIANYKQIMNGESGLTGLAGKVVKIGDKLKKNEADLARGRRTTADKAQYDKWKAAEVKQEGLVKEYEAAFDLWEKESEKISKVYNSVRDKNTKAREELKKKYNDLKLQLDNAQKVFDTQMDEIQKLIDEQENMDATDIINKIDRKFLMNINNDAIDEAFNKMPSSSFQPKKQKEFKLAATYGGKKDGWDKLIDALERQNKLIKPIDTGVKDPYDRYKGHGGRGDRGSLPTKHLKKQQAYSIDQPIISTAPSKKKRRVVSASYELQGTPIMEKKLKKPKQFFNQADIKPLFPEDPPPKLKNGWHPRYGKVANRFNRLDPQSAKAMPPTGDPEIDTKVRKAAKKPK